MDNKDIINVDCQGWPEYKKSLLDILKTLGFKDDGQYIKISNSANVLKLYPRRLISDCMGYGVDEQYIIVSDTDSKTYINLFTEKEWSEEEKDKWFKENNKAVRELMCKYRKYLFLDIDGVLNHESWYETGVKKQVISVWWEQCFDPECVHRVNRILNETNAKLVVSSSWRKDSKIKEIFKKMGLPTDFNVTSTIIEEDEDGSAKWVERGREIEAFLKENPCKNYVILDDDMDFTDEQIEKHLVHCDSKFGLTDELTQKAINILNG